ncbi:uncharacterized protein LOC117645685 isoform X2 [Thrips palmi]|uniref:Uncharacterized protein LOC117645685 isoform X2 n=1 Tax=Thrips palmi TaxID=161013 RepID=A0A6P8YX95_THRPL|nr:uncharacterized protein LOC117645685 isoform X2 [Thrips palmi]
MLETPKQKRQRVVLLRVDRSAMRVSCVVLLATAVIGCGLTTANAAEPSLADLNGHSIWTQLEEGFRGLQQAALGRPMRLHPALQQALRGVPGVLPDGSPASAEDERPDEPPEQHDEEDLLSGVMSDEKGDEDSSEEEDDGDDGDAAFPAGPMLFPIHSLFDSFSSVWWKGPNVCITREETDETPKKASSSASSSQEDGGDSSDSRDSSPEDHSSSMSVQSWLMPGMFQDFHFSSCSQTPTTYECTTRSAHHGVRKKVVTTYRCCHGARREYGRSGCKLVDMSSMLDTAGELGSVFSKMVVSSGAQSVVELAGNATLFVPTNDAMEDYYDVILDQNRVRRALGPHPVVPVMVSDEEAPEAPATLPVRGQPEHEPLPMPVAMAQSDTVLRPDAAVPEDFSARSDDETTDAVPEAKMDDAVTAPPKAPKVPKGDAEVEPKVDEAERKDNTVVPKKGWRINAAKAKDPLDNELADLPDSTLVGAHRVEGLVDLLEVRNDHILNTTAGTTIRLNVFATGPKGRTVTANCARITQERPAVGGMVYQVEKVLRPVKAERTIAHLLHVDPRLSTMKRLVEQAGLMETLKTTSPLTAFFPTDEAFDKMDPAMRFKLLSGEGCVGAFVSHLLAKHTVCTDAARMRVSAQTLDGDFVMLRRVPADVDVFTLDDVKLGPHDIMASNGVLHLLDDVVLPDSARPVSQLLKSRNLTHWYDLLEKADLLEEVDAAQNVTLFVPNKAAMLSPEGELLTDFIGKLGEEKNKAALRDVLRLHLARPAVELDKMRNNQMLPTSLDDTKLRVNLYATVSCAGIPFLNGAITSATVQCARVEDANNKACGAVLHEVDRVLRPAEDSVMQMVEQRADLSVLRDIIKASSFAEKLSQPNSADFPAFTLLAPTNDAFEELKDAERVAKLKTDKGHADSFVQRHVLPSTLCCSGVGVSSWMFTHRVPSLKKDVAHKVRRDGLNRPHIGDAVVQQCDAIGSNGIMHVIDTPLIPPTVRQTAPQNNRRRTSNLEILLFGLK